MTTLLVDANNLLMRAAFATERADMSGAGVSTAALHVFIQTLARHVREEKPDTLLVAWDHGKSAYRLNIYPEYKAARPDKTGADKVEGPHALAKEFLSLAGVHHVSLPHVEADDIIAYYVGSRFPTNKVVILSSDKDFMQLLAPGVEQVRLSSAGVGTDRWDHHRVKEKMGCDPWNLPKVMALTGDVSDGVPGIPGFGTKTAVKVLERNDWDLVKAGQTEPKLEGMRDDINRNLCLVDLIRPLPLGLPDLPGFLATRPGSLLHEPLLEFFDRYLLRTTKQRYLLGNLWVGSA